MAGQVISRLTSSGGDDAGVHVISSSFYGTCSSAANSENKIVIIQNRNVEQVNLTKGMLLTVKFTNKNDYSESLPSLQLFKNEAAPDSIPIIGNALTIPMTIFAQQNSNIKPNWSAGSVVTFIYDTYIKQNQDGTTSTLGCWIKTAGLSEEIFDNLNIRIDNVESASTIAISGVTDRVNSIESNITQAAVVGDIEFIYWPIDSTTTPPVTPAASYDWEETFNVNCEWNTDALPYVFGLDIWQRTKSFTIGNASNPTYSDPIRITGRDGAKGDKGDQGDPGATGSPAYSYDLVTNVTSLIRNVNTNPVINNPSTITFSATKTEGNNVPTPYLEGKLTVSEYIYDINESKWKWNVLENKTSFSVSNQSITVTPSIAATSVMGILFASDGTTELDKQTIPIIETGRNGSSVTVDSIQYGTSETEAATPQSWNASIPTTITPGWWLWTRTSYVGVATPAISKSYIGTDGEDGTSITIQSISKDEGTTTVILNNGDGTTAALIIEDGTDGENGQQGPAGYIHTAWANGIGQTAQDFIDFSRTNENNLTYLYMGVYTDNEEEDSNDPLDYSWTLIKGEDGNDAIVAYLTNESGSFAATSSAAVTASVSSQFVINKGGQTLTAIIKSITPDPVSSLPAYNAGALTVTSSNDTFTIGINPNFTTTAYQHNGSFEITASATVNGISQDFTKDFSWVLVPAGVDGTNGTNGFNFANIRLYQIANQPPEKPRNDLIYTFNNQTLTPTSDLNGWSINMPDMTSVTPGLSCYLISANAASLESTDIIKGIGINESEEDQSDWYGPIVYVQNGKDGLDAYNRASISLYQRSLTEPTEPTNPINYTFSTGILTPSDSLGNWTTGVTAATNGEPCWVITANAISKNETYTITDWSNPAIFTQDGADGEGISITNREIHYVESNSGTVTPSDSASWNTNIPTVAEGNYLWTRTKITYSDGNVLTSYSVAKQGKSITVTGSSIQYATNNSTTTPTSGWQSNPPTTTPGWYIWTKTTTNYSDESSVVSYSVSKTGTNGSNAYLYELHCDPSVIIIDQNVQTPTFSPAAISLSATRTNGNNTPAAYNGRFKLEWTSDNNTWTPIYNGTVNESSKNCSIANVSTAATSFKATLYATGGNSNTLDTETIPVIRGGKNGINGYNQSTVYLYKRSDTQPTAPSNNHTYNFANKTFTDATSDKIENWTINKMPAADGDKVAWMTFAVASSTTSTDEIVSTEWSTPVKIEGVDGTDGYNQTVVQLYQRYNSQNENDTPTKPANNSLTYTFNTNKLTGNGLGNWSQQIPAPNGSPCWITVGVARSQSNSDVIDSWSDPTIYNKDGADGYNKATVYLYQRATSAPNRPSEELIYTFNNQTLTPTPGSTSGNNFLNNWSQTIPSNSTNPLWMTAAVANNTAVSDSILATEWSVPTKMEGVDGQPGQSGQPGTNGYNQATIDLYKRADSAPTSMPGTLTYTFGATNPLSNPANGWSQTIPTTNGQPCWVTSGVAISQNTSATISNWSTPTKILEDPINVVIDNDNVTFPTTNGAATKTTVTCNIKAFKGLTQVPCTIGSISGTVTGIATSKTNGTTTTPTAKVTITASNTTSALLTTEQGTLTIPITISGVANSINKQFTWSLAKNGLNQATLYLYKRADSATKPTSGNDSVYSFTNKTLTNIPSGWSTTFPAETQGSTTPVWVMTAVASSNTDTDNIAYTEWSTPVKYVSSGSNGQPGKDGEDAYNQADVFLYRRATTAITPVFANNSITYTFSTGINGLNSSYNTNTSPAITWYTSVTAATNSQNDYMPCWMSSVHPISQNASVDISNNWSAPTIYIQPGIGIKNVIDYYVATSSTNVTINNTDWVVPDEGADPPIHMPQIDSTNKYLWNYEVTTYTDNTTRTINPHIVATYGRDGTNVTITSIQYGTSNSAATEPTSWSPTAPTSIATGKWVWVKTTYSNNSTSINKSYVGTNGTNGQPGTSSYTHIAWANSTTGTDFTKNSANANGKLYLGICINNTQSDSSLTYDKYTWSLIQGKSVVSIKNKYKLTETLNRPAITDTGWVEPNDNTPIPTVSSINKYLWTYEITTYANPSDTATTQPHLIGAYGDKGIGVQDIIEQAILWEYDDSDLETHPAPANNRNDWQPRESVVWESGKYIWVRTKIIWTEGNPTYIGPELAKNDNNIGEQLDRNVLIKSGSGEIITTDDCAPLPPIEITVFGKSVQDGTPTPSAPVAIESIEPQNLLDDSNVYNLAVSGSNIASNASYRAVWCEIPPASSNRAFSFVRNTVEGNRFRVYGTTEEPASGVTASALHSSDDSALSGWFPVPQAYRYIFIYLSNAGGTISAGNIAIYDGADAPSTVIPYGSLGVSIKDADNVTTTYPIDLQGNSLCSLPDGTRDELRVGERKVLVKRCEETLQAVTDGVTGTVGVDVLSSTGQIANGAQVVYKLAAPQEIDLGPASDFPNLPSPNMSIWVDGTTIDAEWWTQYGYETGRAKLDITSVQKEVTNTQTSLEKTVVETNQWWFITDRYENFDLFPPKRLIFNENTETYEEESWIFNNQTGNYDNWVLEIPASYIEIDPNNPPNRYEITNIGTSEEPDIKIKDTVIKEFNENRDITKFCVIKENSIQKYYPYNYYCYEYKFMDGSTTYSNVIYDSVKSAIAQNKLVEEEQNELLRQMIESQKQFFYSDTNGAHVKDLNTEYRTDWNSFGMTFWKQDAKLLAILASPDSEGLYSGMTIYNGKTGFDEQNNPREKVVAKFTPGLIQLGSDKDSNRLSITPSAIRFIKDSTAAAYIENSQFYTPNITIDSSLYLETPKESIESQNTNQEYRWAWIPRSNGNVSFKWVGKL